MVELVMRKRGARHTGELGLFIDSQVFESDFSSIKNGADVEIKAIQHRSLKQMRLAWALAHKLLESGIIPDAHDANDVMDFLKIKARHVRYIHDTYNNETIIVPKSIRFASMDQTLFSRFWNRCIHIVTTELLPDIKDDDLRHEIELMAGVIAPELVSEVKEF